MLRHLGIYAAFFTFQEATGFTAIYVLFILTKIRTSDFPFPEVSINPASYPEVPSSKPRLGDRYTDYGFSWYSHIFQAILTGFLWYFSDFLVKFQNTNKQNKLRGP